MQEFARDDHAGVGDTPFGDGIFAGGTGLPGVAGIHGDAFLFCRRAIDGHLATAPARVRSGKVILLISPRAGYGKTHLIARIEDAFPDVVTPLKLPFSPGWVSHGEMLKSVIRSQESSFTGEGEVSRLDRCGSYFLKRLMRSAITQGVIGGKDCPVSISSLDEWGEDPFPGVEDTRVREWLKERAFFVSRYTALPERDFRGFTRADVAFWTRFFLSRLTGIAPGPSVFDRMGAAEARIRFLQFLALSSQCRPLLIEADHLDGCLGRSGSGLEVARMLIDVKEHVPRSVILLSLNQPEWEVSFGATLPPALIDRLDSERVTLNPCGIEAARALVAERLAGTGRDRGMIEEFVEFVAREGNWGSEKELYPRRILREAAAAWRQRGETSRPAGTNADDAGPEALTGLVFDEPAGGKKGPEGIRWSEISGFDSGADPDPFEVPVFRYPDRPLPESLFGSSKDKGTSGRPTGRASRAPRPGPRNRFRIPDGTIESGQFRVTRRVSGNGKTGNATGGQTGFPPNGEKGEGVTWPEEWAAGARSAPPSLETKFSGILNRHLENPSGAPFDVTALERLIGIVGRHHPAVVQREISVNGGGRACLKWKLDGQCVWIGFEPTRNVYFYSSILQRVLIGAAPGKVVCFSHPSFPFSERLCSSLGLNVETLRLFIDVIDLNDREWGMIRAAVDLYDEVENLGNGGEALDLILEKLGPLWRRIEGPLKEE